MPRCLICMASLIFLGKAIEEEDQKEENQRIRKALADCGYPKWAMDRVQEKMKANTTRTKKSNNNKDNPSRGMVIIPYVENVAEKFQRICWKHSISVAMRPTNTLKSRLVHPKDKKDKLNSSEVVDEVSCKGCDKTYVGETGRQLGIRITEHQKDTEKIADKKFTRAARKSSTSELHKSAITDHVAQYNHVIDWDEVKILDRDSIAFPRKIREAIQIRQRGNKVLNRDECVFSLDHYTTHCFLNPNFLRKSLRKQLIIAGKTAVDDTCDQDLSQ